MNVLTYEQLKAQLDAVVAERDALAAENCIQDTIITAVKDLVRESEGVIGWHLNGDVASWDEVLPELSHSETPTTDAALAEVEAKAIEKGIERITILMNHQAPAVAQVINTLQMYAKALREAFCLF